MSMVYSGKSIFWFDRKGEELAKINHLDLCFLCHWCLRNEEFGVYFNSFLTNLRKK